MCDETILFTPIPQCDELCRIVCRITNIIEMNGFPKSFYHSQIYICRFILDAFPETIAAPVPGTENCFQIIVRKVYLQTRKLQIFLKSENLWFSDPQAVNFGNYKECAMYTIKFKLSPSWNRLGCYLCQGIDFLTDNDTNAIKFDIVINKQGMFLKLKFVKLQFNPLKLQDLQLPSSLLAEFKQNPEGVIKLGYISANVLPSTFKARLLKVSKQLTANCTFQNYEELRLYWKNMYGYLLPESSKGILYYEVHFKSFPNDFFLYPDICLHTEFPKMSILKNYASTCIQFVEDLKKDFHSICGKALFFVKSNLDELTGTPSLRFIPALEIKTENTDSETVPPIYGKFKADCSKIVNRVSGRKLKQQTLNFPKQENIPVTSSQDSNSINYYSKNESVISKIKNPELSAIVLSQYTQSKPIYRKLLNDPKREDDDNISQKSETYKSLMNLIKCNETSRKRSNPKEKELVNNLLQEKPDLSAFIAPPSKRIRIFKKQPPLESVDQYFRVQKSAFNKPTLKVETNRLQFHNLKKTF